MRLSKYSLLINGIYTVPIKVLRFFDESKNRPKTEFENLQNTSFTVGTIMMERLCKKNPGRKIKASNVIGYVLMHCYFLAQIILIPLKA